MSGSFGPPGWTDAGPPAPLDVPTAHVPPPVPVPAPAARPQGRAEVPADRTRFDNRRLKAAIVDSLLVGLVPLGLLIAGNVVTDGAFLVFNAFALIYYFLCEVTTGQTVGKRRYGLRVVAEDGTPATPAQISARTVLRVIDNSVVGILVLVLSGKRRKRLGDFLGRTVVVDALPDPGRPARSPLTIVYPVGWAGAALAAFFAIGHHGDTYLADIEMVCEQRTQVIEQLPKPLLLAEAVMVVEEEVAILEELEPPPARRAMHAEMLALRRHWLREAQRADHRVRMRPKASRTELTRLARTADPVDDRLAALGLTACEAPRPRVA